MSYILIDRRKAGKGKSSPNRQKLIKRIKSYIKSSTPQNIGQGGVSGSNAKSSSPVKITGAALEEPFFTYATDGVQTSVLIGNSEYNRGDEIVIDEEEGDVDGEGGDGDNGEDDFIVNIARGEFLELFFEDCELPNLVNERYTDKLENTFQHAGFSTTGNPAQLSIIRTYKQALGRRLALKGPYKDEKEELEAEMKAIYDDIALYPREDMVIQKWAKRLDEIEARLTAIQNKFAFLDGFDKSDLRYRKKESQPLKTVDAVLFMVMDISGSMDQNKKEIARRWFALLYAFIEKRYKGNGTVALHFIAHTTEAMELSETDFFSTRVNGGTAVSPAIKMINDIIVAKYDPNQTNIYVSHASDGDNWSGDNVSVIDEMIGKGNLCGKIQFFNYVEVGGDTRYVDTNSNLWEAYDEVRVSDQGKKKIILALIPDGDACYSTFKAVFRKGRK
jgi:uncharacterized sporulation protein YeaH/YhbH (DUF444 family)